MVHVSRCLSSNVGASAEFLTSAQPAEGGIEVLLQAMEVT